MTYAIIGFFGLSMTGGVFAASQRVSPNHDWWMAWYSLGLVAVIWLGATIWSLGANGKLVKK